MVELDKLRVTKLKCLTCGSRDKRVSILAYGPKNEKIGFTTTCCNCGQTLTYKFKDKKSNPINNKELALMLEGRCHVSCMFCAIPHPFCPNKKCDLYNKCTCNKDLRFKDIKNENYGLSSFERVDTIRDFVDFDTKDDTTVDKRFF